MCAPLVVMMCLFLFSVRALKFYIRNKISGFFFLRCSLNIPCIFWRHCEQELLFRRDCISSIILVRRQMFSGALWGMRVCYCWLGARFNSMERKCHYPNFSLHDTSFLKVNFLLIACEIGEVNCFSRILWPEIKWDILAYTYGPSYLGGWGSRILSSRPVWGV